MFLLTYFSLPPHIRPGNRTEQEANDLTCCDWPSDVTSRVPSLPIGPKRPSVTAHGRDALRTNTTLAGFFGSHSRFPLRAGTRIVFRRTFRHRGDDRLVAARLLFSPGRRETSHFASMHVIKRGELCFLPLLRIRVASVSSGANSTRPGRLRQKPVSRGFLVKKEMKATN